MRRTVNSTKVAERAGVSRTTVSLVLNGRDRAARIPSATRDRVLRAAEELGYTPNHLARTLLSGRSYMIGLLVERVHPAFFSRVIESFYAVLGDTGYDLRVQETERWTDADWQAVSKDRWPADGLIVVEEVDTLPLLLEALHGDVPVVSVGGAYREEIDHVGVDLAAGTAEAIRHLAALGRSRIAFLGAHYVRTMSRWSVYEAEIRRMGGEPQMIVTEPGAGRSEREAARIAMTEYLDANAGRDRCDALFCFNDEAAVGALRALKERGVRVPEDVALVGCDDIEETTFHDPPLSSLHYPYEEVARLAWETLRQRIENPDLPRQAHVLTPELIVRRSSSPKERIQ